MGKTKDRELETFAARLAFAFQAFKGNDVEMIKYHDNNPAFFGVPTLTIHFKGDAKAVLELKSRDEVSILKAITAFLDEGE